MARVSFKHPGLIRTAFWGGMLLTHVGALWATWGDVWGNSPAEEWGTSLLRALGLTLSALFFGLKIADVPWLRLPPGRRPIIAFAMVVALLHFGVVERAAEVDWSRGVTPLGVVMLAGSLLESERVRRAVMRLPRAVVCAPDAPKHPMPSVCGLTGPVWERVFKPKLVRIVAGNAPLRAPPF